MNRFLYGIFLILLSAITGCAGTGIKSYSYDRVIAPIVNDKEKGKVFIYRRNMFVGGGVIIPMKLNGIEIGRIGNDEIIWSEGKLGLNTLQAKVDGIQGWGAGAPKIVFENDKLKNHFFVVD